MIRINLLGAPKPKSGKKGAAVSMPSFESGGGGGSPMLQVAAVLVVFGLFNAGYWYRLDSEKKSIAVKMRVAEQKNRELADIKARYLERQRQADAYKRRVDVIDNLRNNQTGPSQPAGHDWRNRERHRSCVAEQLAGPRRQCCD